MTARSRHAVVAGIGSEFRCDDAVGLMVAREVASAAPAAVDVGPCGDPIDLLGRWDDADVAVVIDATRSGAPPGTVRLFDLDSSSTPSTAPTGAPASSHGLGVDEVHRLSRAIGGAPRRVFLVGIEGMCFDEGLGLSPEVAGAVARATALVLDLVSEVT